MSYLHADRHLEPAIAAVMSIIPPIIGWHVEEGAGLAFTGLSVDVQIKPTSVQHDSITLARRPEPLSRAQ